MALALVIAPFAVSAVVLLLHDPGVLIRDHALTELRVRDVGTHPVLIGLYSRDGWSHPGPLLFYMLAVPYRLTGSSPAGLLIGALAINAAAIAGMAAVARQLGGLRVALLTVVGSAVVARALGAGFLLDPWVCYVTVLPFGLFCYLAWAMVERRAWALPTATALAAWLVQTHVGYAPLTAPALGVGALWLWVAVRRDGAAEDKRRVMRATIVAAALLVLLFIPTAWDQLFGSGNLDRLVSWFGNGAEGTHTITEGARIVLAQYAPVPDWVTGTRRFGMFGETPLQTMTLWPLLVVPLVAAVVIAWRRRDRSVLRLAVVTVFMLVIGVISVSQTIGTMYEYRLLWTWLLGMLGALVIAWTAWNVVAARWANVEARLLVPLAMAALGVLSVLGIVDAVQDGTPSLYSKEAQRLTNEVASQLDRDGGEVTLASASYVGEWYLQGLVLGLERKGIDARVVADPTERFGEHRVRDRGKVDARLLVLVDDDLNGFTSRPDLELVAYAGPVPLAERAEIGRRMDDRARRLLEDLSAGKMTRDVYVRRAATLIRPGPAVAVFRETAGT